MTKAILSMDVRIDKDETAYFDWVADEFYKQGGVVPLVTYKWFDYIDYFVIPIILISYLSYLCIRHYVYSYESLDYSNYWRLFLATAINWSVFIYLFIQKVVLEMVLFNNEFYHYYYQKWCQIVNYWYTISSAIIQGAPILVPLLCLALVVNSFTRWYFSSSQLSFNEWILFKPSILLEGLVRLKYLIFNEYFYITFSVGVILLIALISTVILRKFR